MQKILIAIQILRMRITMKDENNNKMVAVQHGAAGIEYGNVNSGTGNLHTIPTFNCME